MFEALGGASGLGTLFSGLGSLYSGYMQNKMGNKMFNLERQNLLYNRDQEKKRLDGLGSLGNYYSGTANTVGSMNNNQLGAY